MKRKGNCQRASRNFGLGAQRRARLAVRQRSGPDLRGRIVVVAGVADAVYLIAAPLAMLLVTAFRGPVEFLPFEPGARWTLDNVIQIYTEAVLYERIIPDTLIFVAGSFALSFSIGFGLAWLVERTDLLGREAWFTLILIPRTCIFLGLPLATLSLAFICTNEHIQVTLMRRTATVSRGGLRPRGRRTGAMPDGRQALLRAATRAFAAYGFEGADVRSIAAAADVSPNLIRVHFGSKAELWEACLDSIVAAAAPVMADVAKLAAENQRPLVERLHDVILRVARFYAAHPEVRDFVARHGVESPERANLAAERLLRPAYETVRELFAAGIEAGFIRSSHPALFFALLNSAASQPSAFPALLSQLAPEIDPRSAHDEMAQTIIATLLHRPDERRAAQVDASGRALSRVRGPAHR